MYEAQQCCVCWQYVATGRSHVTISRWGHRRSYSGDLCYHCQLVLETMCEQMVQTRAPDDQRLAQFRLETG